MRKFALAFALLVPFAAPASAVTIMGHGVGSCGTWLEARTNDRREYKRDKYWIFRADTMSAWALGYLSSAAVRSGTDPLKNLDALGVFHWLDNYCQSRPTQSFGEALEAFLTSYQLNN